MKKRKEPLTMTELFNSKVSRKEKKAYIYDNFPNGTHYEKLIEFYELERDNKPVESMSMYSHYIETLKQNMKSRLET